MRPAAYPGRVLVSMLGARMHYAVPRLFYEAGLLCRLHTDSYIGGKPLLEGALRLLPRRSRPRAVQRWLGRKDANLPADVVCSSEALGLWYVIARRRAASVRELNSVYRLAAQRLTERVLRAGLDDADVVWAFNNEALELFEAAKSLGKRCILEQTILPVALEYELMQEEARRWANWTDARDRPEFDEVAVQRAEAEWRLADQIVAASAFVRDGLVRCGVPSTKISVIPYGVDVSTFGTSRGAQARSPGPLRVLFAGEVGLRKGALDLLFALEELGPSKVEARFAGRIALKSDALARFHPVAQFLGPVPRTSMAQLYAWADVFVLPSICEGSATVTYEALLSGLPVICTANTGSIVQDGIEGFIVKVRDPASLVERLGRYIEDEGLLATHAAAARRARPKADLARYGQDLVKLIEASC
jgi:glycosyltransferase involved in cell wall biosynthesis